MNKKVIKHYHESKAKRRIKYMEMLKGKLSILEDNIPRQIFELKKEISEILESEVTLTCKKCGKQYNVSIKNYIAKTHADVCFKCIVKTYHDIENRIKELTGYDDVVYDAYSHLIRINPRDKMPWVYG